MLPPFMVSRPAPSAISSARRVGAGLPAWTLIEYVPHRWMLHGIEPFQRWHLAHHRHAGVTIRVPVLFSVLLVLAVVGLPALISGGSAYAAPLAAGMVGLLTGEFHVEHSDASGEEDSADAPE